MMKTIACAALFLLSACASIELGREFDPAAFDAKVVRGKTTRDDVRAWLGAPAGVGAAIESDGERLEQWTYYRAEGHLPGMKDARFKMLQIKFDRGGAVRSYNWSADSVSKN